MMHPSVVWYANLAGQIVSAKIGTKTGLRLSPYFNSKKEVEEWLRSDKNPNK